MSKAGDEGARTRRLARLLAIGASALWPAANAGAADKLWIDTSDVWSDNLNWSPWGVPGAGDTAVIGSLDFTADYSVTVDGNYVVGGVELSNGMRIHTGNGKLAVLGETHVSGLTTTGSNATELLVWNSAFAIDFDTDDLTVEDGGRVWVTTGARLDVDERFTIDAESRLYGEGLVRLNGAGEVLQNDGLITAAPGLLTIQTAAGGGLDLDGATGDGVVQAISWGAGPEFANLVFDGGTLTDVFNGEMRVIGGGSIVMNLDAPWATGAGSELRFSGLEAHPGAAVLTGAALTVGGDVVVDVNDHGRILADTTFNSAANVQVATDGLLELDGAAEVDGATFDLSHGGQLRFDGGSTQRGGQFSTASADAIDGEVRFGGATHWAGGVTTINGVARHSGTASVTGANTIEGDVFDLDGASGATEWSVAGPLTLNVTQIETNAENRFDGVLTVGGLSGNVVVNLADPGASWQMDGELNLNGLGGFTMSRLGGSEVSVTGTTNVSQGVAINADATFADGSELNFAGGSSRLRMTGASQFDGGVAVTGAGALANGPAGHMTLADGMALGAASLQNAGVLEVDAAAGLVTVEEFAQTAEGEWLIDLGGPVAGDQHDALLAGGTATLDGELAVSLIDAGGGLFVPTVGDAFTVLTAVGGVSGAFTNDPVTAIGGQVFEWDVQYGGASVTLALADITGLPGDYNLDGTVDAVDYNVWRDSLGDETVLAADGNLDGVVDDADHAVWAANYGASLPPVAMAMMASAAAIPEPAALGMALGAVAVGLVRRRRS